ncbi:MAG: hypothetical protein BWK73_24490 [Thiothrix lacustris]|uniref:Transport permease protein n=1 Tax=Thiothrix lacustris TaxID=525917 RepID=A0A1Y1QLR9_9GAMM|nr:MAG: hypothetical protein BWK73_24490 [Thiothrix lacustris]
MKLDISLERREYWKQQGVKILLFAKWELHDQFRNRLLGGAWLFLQPLSYILIFTLVFSHLMNARLQQFDSPYAYSIYLISGMLLWNLMAGILQRLTNIYSEKAGLIRKVPVSLALMPLYVPLVELVIFLIAGAFFGVFLIFIEYSPSYYWLWLPVIVLLSVFFTYSLGLILGILSVFMPDLRNFIGILLQLAFWMTPIVYVDSILPVWVNQWLVLNPFYWGVSNMHQIILHGQAPNLYLLALLLTAGIILALFARYLQKRLEKDVRDLL